MTVSFRGAVLRQRGLPRPYGESRPFEIVELELPDPGPGEVLVEVGAAGICRSDLSVVTGARVWPLPMVVGHEAAGQVAAVGDDVTRVVPGDDVVLVYLPQCGRCPRCQSGEPWLCKVGMAANLRGELLTGGTRLTHQGEPIHHHMGVAAFAEYALVAEESVVPIPPGLPARDTAVFGCAVLCGAGTVVNTAGVQPGDTVAVVGLGAVGLSAVAGAVTVDAARIVALDVAEEKLAAASSLGASDVLLADDLAVERIRELTGGGIDHAIEASGTLEGFELAANLVRPGGAVTTLGLPGPDVAYPLHLAALVASGITIRGSYLGSCDVRNEVPRFVELYRRGRFPASELVTHYVELEDLNEALDRLADAQALRQVIEF